jgi:hypothetical protein
MHAGKSNVIPSLELPRATSGKYQLSYKKLCEEAGYFCRLDLTGAFLTQVLTAFY